MFFIGIISVSVGVVLYNIPKYKYLEFSLPFIVCGIITTIIVSLALIIAPLNAKKELNMFMEQKEYVEHYKPTSAYDTAAIATKKLELNEWLYDKQYTYTNYAIFSFYGKDIMDIEPIK